MPLGQKVAGGVGRPFSQFLLIFGDALGLGSEPILIRND
jgi:hypothetical protein